MWIESRAPMLARLSLAGVTWWVNLQHSAECVRCCWKEGLRSILQNIRGVIVFLVKLGTEWAQALLHSEECGRCLRKVVVLLMLCLRCHELRPSQTMLPDSDQTQQHCYLMKPNVFESRTPISKVAMLGCYHDVVNLCACNGFLFHFA